MLVIKMRCGGVTPFVWEGITPAVVPRHAPFALRGLAVSVVLYPPALLARGVSLVMECPCQAALHPAVVMDTTA